MSVELIGVTPEQVSGLAVQAKLGYRGIDYYSQVRKEMRL